MATTLDKFLNGQSVGEYRRGKKATRKTFKTHVKTEVRQRDGVGCRWPGCDIWRKGVRVEAAHLDDMGMGGDPRNLRTQADSLMRLCWEHHQGVRSLHSGHLDIERHPTRGTDGPCKFLHRDSLMEPFEVFAIEDEATFARRHKRRNEPADDGADEAEA